MKVLFFPMVAILAIASTFVVAQDAYGCTGFCPATKSVGSPPEQTRSGILPNNVTCNTGLELVIKSEDGSPACVSPKNVTVLVERGWARHESYYYDAHVEPKTILNDYMYKGIDSKDNVTVSINNQTYYQTTLDYSAYNLPRAVSIQFQNVTFSFPEGTVETPGGALVMLDMKFQDGFEETYGTHTANGGSGIPVPTQYGIHQAVNSTTVLSNHMEPQAGMTIYHDRIKLLVSADVNSIMQTQPHGYLEVQTDAVPQNVNTLNNCTSKQIRVYDPGPLGGFMCPITSFHTYTKVDSYSGFDGVCLDSRYGADNYVLKPGHNGSITYTIYPDLPFSYAIQFPHVSITNDASFSHYKPTKDGGAEFTYTDTIDGTSVSFEPISEVVWPWSLPAVTAKMSAATDAKGSSHWLLLSPGVCNGGLGLILTIDNSSGKDQ